MDFLINALLTLYLVGSLIVLIRWLIDGADWRATMVMTLFWPFFLLSGFLVGFAKERGWLR